MTSIVRSEEGQTVVGRATLAEIALERPDMLTRW